MPPKVDFSDTGEDPVAPLPVKRGSINRPDRDELAAASAVAENAGFATRSTASSIDPVPGRESEGIRRRRKPGRPRDHLQSVSLLNCTQRTFSAFATFATMIGTVCPISTASELCSKHTLPEPNAVLGLVE